jgi:hypothetical protein
MDPPRYQEVIAADIPVVQEDGAAVRVVAGEFGGTRGPVMEIAARPLYMDVSLEPNAEFTLSLPEGHFVVAYLFEGGGNFGLNDDDQGQQVEAVQMLIFGEGDHIRVRADENSPARFMLMAGAPFKEPIVPYGPFVMNTREEIQQALFDLRNGTFVKSSAI